MEENMVVTRDPITFYFNFDWHKHVVLQYLSIYCTWKNIRKQ